MDCWATCYKAEHLFQAALDLLLSEMRPMQRYMTVQRAGGRWRTNGSAKGECNSQFQEGGTHVVLVLGEDSIIDGIRFGFGGIAIFNLYNNKMRAPFVLHEYVTLNAIICAAMEKFYGEIV